MDGLVKLTLLFAAFLSSWAASVREAGGDNRARAQGMPRVAPRPVPGLPWPMPQQYVSTDNVIAVRGGGFQFNLKGQQCDVLTEAFDRYYNIMFGRGSAARKQEDSLWEDADDDAITALDVYVLSPCDTYPKLGFDESYQIGVTEGNATLVASTQWGALRGLETFSQIVYQAWYDSHDLYLVNETKIVDAPRFAHRGLLLDTARHFLEKEIIMQVLEAMAQNKLNVLHWHIVDDESFPYVSSAYPELSRYGAYDQYTHVYTPDDVQEVIEYARLRGIRVIPEFDSPGHSQSWGKGRPGLLTPCYDSSGKPDGSFGPIDPTVNGTYDFVSRLFKEVFAVFPDGFIHLGGDEVSFDCWKSNPIVANWMQAIGFGTNYTLLESYYIQNVLNIVNSFGPDYRYIVWEEIFDNGNKIKPDTVVEVWLDNAAGDKIAKVTEAGYAALQSSCWYLNYISYGQDWLPFYKCDPQNFTGTDAQKNLVIGGEICMWSEFVDGANVMTRTWPRASVAAERLWSAADVTDVTSATIRLETHRCRMLGRGLDVEPVNGAGFCPQEKQGVAPRR